MYNLRPRRHELALARKGDARNFLERQLFKDTYLAVLQLHLLLSSYVHMFTHFTYVRLRSVSRILHIKLN